MSWHPERIGAVVREELRRFGRPGDLADIVSAWPDAVGPAIAAQAWPARLARDGTLHVATSSSVWAFELTKLAAAILPRLAERLGDRTPATLRFAPGRLPARAPETVSSASPTVPEVRPADLAAGAEIARAIEDPELRELVARAAAASLARRDADRRF